MVLVCLVKIRGTYANTLSITCFNATPIKEAKAKLNFSCYLICRSWPCFNMFFF